jgi:hypothetical protein
MSFSSRWKGSIVILLEVMIFRVHTMKVLEIGPGFNLALPHRRMRRYS